MIDLSTSRARIDEIDERIIELFCDRMRVAADVAAYKRATGKPVLDKAREASKIAAAQDAASPEFRQYMAPLFNMIMEMSRAYQSALLDRTPAPIPAPASYGALPAGARVVVQGVGGAYQHIAAQRLFDEPAIEFVHSWPDVCDAVEGGKADFGILPLENSTAGTVDRVYDLLSRRGLSIVRALTLRIDHDLLAKPGVSLSDVREVFSHEQALRQCEAFIDGLGDAVRSTACRNTAMAAAAVAQSDRADVAAISSSACADIYGLNVLAHAIQDEADNFTRFICVAREPALYGAPDRTSLLLVLPHEPGSLFRVLSRLAALGVNMLKLESRPIPGREFEFMFYVDVECVPGDAVFAQMMSQIAPLCDSCCYLGSYEEVSA